jgi:DNA-binding NarL/FixJ family response regulator
MRVFIIEDSKVVLDRLASMLAEYPGVEIVGTSSGPQKGLRGAAEAKPDVMILDIRLQGGTGWDVLKGLRLLPQRPLVIMLTNFPSAFHRSKALAEGADFFLDKAQEFDKILPILKDWAEGKIGPKRPPAREGGARRDNPNPDRLSNTKE